MRLKWPHLAAARWPAMADWRINLLAENIFPAAAPTMRAPRPSAMVVPDMDESPFFFASIDGPSGIRYKRTKEKETF